MTVKILTETRWAIVECSECGIEFCISNSRQTKLRETHSTFYCPNGHRQWYPHKSETERLREELKRAQDITTAEQTRRVEAERRANDCLDKLNHLHKRVNAGVCPDCHRHFVNVERHMATKHGKLK